jgi:hypothetical protein
MVKFSVKIETEDEFELKAYINATRNHVNIEELYDEVFRPVIKYGEDEDKSALYHELWLKCQEHFKRGICEL